MNILELIRTGLEYIQEIEPGVQAAGRVGAVVGPIVVQTVAQGKKLYAYLVTLNEKKQADDQLSEAATDETVSAKELSPGMPTITKDDVALIVDINRRTFQDVARYLENRNIDADIVLLTNDPHYGNTTPFLDTKDPTEWESLVQDFYHASVAIKHAVGQRRAHIFLSTPVALAFGMGAVWSTVDKATVYQWDGSTYQPVMPISHKLRSEAD